MKKKQINKAIMIKQNIYITRQLQIEWTFQFNFSKSKVVYIKKIMRIFGCGGQNQNPNTMNNHEKQAWDWNRGRGPLQFYSNVAFFVFPPLISKYLHAFHTHAYIHISKYTVRVLLEKGIKNQSMCYIEFVGFISCLISYPFPCLANF